MEKGNTSSLLNRKQNKKEMEGENKNERTN